MNLKTPLAFRAIAVLLALCAALVTAPARALPPAPPPVPALSDSTAIIFYFWGVLEAREDVEVWDPITCPFTFAEMAAQSYMTAQLFSTTSPIIFAYFWGRGDGFSSAAAARGEP